MAYVENTVTGSSSPTHDSSSASSVVHGIPLGAATFASHAPTIAPARPPGPTPLRGHLRQQIRRRHQHTNTRRALSR
ncbi:hypothetical protein ACIO3O_39160 [Streptomyces sp. NPDC087440]|uniref:hypothetical protein n=1 Tax=Streptomyces sp. NPDC087440 TaxID=3365790 RepID=UPI0037FB5C39